MHNFTTSLTLSKKIFVLLLATCIVASASETPPGGAFHGCPVKGRQGDLALNALKNRTAQVDNPEAISIDDILALKTPTVHTKIPRSRWSAKDKQIVAAQEKRGVQLEGYFDFVRPSGSRGLQLRGYNRYRLPHLDWPAA